MQARQLSVLPPHKQRATAKVQPIGISHSVSDIILLPFSPFADVSAVHKQYHTVYRVGQIK